jgi:hypothetical protein
MASRPREGLLTAIRHSRHRQGRVSWIPRILITYREPLARLVALRPGSAKVLLLRKRQSCHKPREYFHLEPSG